MRLPGPAAALAAALLVIPGVEDRAAAAASAPPEIELGRQIYERGEGAGGREIIATIGADRVEVPAFSLPCVGCHGADGRGRAEGGVSPSNLTWEALTKPYGVRHPTGRQHPPYDERSLIWAISNGADPAGNRLGDAMPRYRLTGPEADALVSFLKRLGRKAEPGLTDSVIRLGVILPPPVLADLGEALAKTLGGLADRYNRAGGFYGRTLELSFVTTAGPPAARRSAVEEMLAEVEPFALVAGFISGADAEIAALAAERQIPLVGPFTLDPQVDLPLNRYVFYLLSGLEQQSRALVDFAAEHLEKPAGRVLVLHPDDERWRQIAASITQQGRRQRGHSWPAITSVEFGSDAPDLPAIVQRERAAGTEAVFLLGSQSDIRAILAAASAVDWQPFFFLPGALMGAVGVLPAEAVQRVYLALPLLGADRRPASVAGYRELLAPDAAGADRAMQFAALAAAEILFEGLKRSGREVTRERLVDELEQLYDFQTGLLPPVTYGPGRRIGSLGAYILAYDEQRRRFSPTGDWISPR